MIRIAILSFWHVHAGDYAKQATEHADTEIIAVWDENKERGQREADRRGVNYYESLDVMLAQPEIDAVIVVAPTNLHRDIMVKAAQAGKHIFTEKVVAATLKETNEILSAVEKAGIKLVVSLPRLYDSYTQAIIKILNEKLLGELTLVRTRLSHNGAIANWLPDHFYQLEETIGGAMIDLGCHPMYLARLFFGTMPESVSAHYGYLTGKEVEDNAVSVLHYPNGAMGIIEAGFVNMYSPFTIEIHGTEGTLLFGTPEPKLLVRSSRQGEEAAKGWQEHEIPDSLPSAFHQWIIHIKEDKTADENIKMAVDLAKLMEASNLSVKKNETIRIDELSN
jgi:1,5-anhydro-D-fructose reductase (1,5-anhydro-D-mannitol-forming)